MTSAFDTATTGAASTETPVETPVETPLVQTPIAEDVSPVVDNIDASKEEPVVAIEGEVPVPVVEGEVPVAVDEVKA